MKGLEGKVAIITGGSRGIGFVIAKEFVNMGCKVLICARNRKELTAACEKIDSTLTKIASLVTDVSQESDCKKLIDFALKKFGTIDILINNVGIYGPIGFLEDNSSNLWKKAIETNFLGTVFCCKYALPSMKKSKKGTIINVAGGGVGSLKTLPHFSAYYSSKIAVVGFSELLADEVKDYNIQVNSISPGAFYTRLTKELLALGVKKIGKEMFDSARMQRQENPSFERLLAFIIFLCSNTSNNITGRFFSSKWDKLSKIKKLKNQNNLYKLRRIDNLIFHEKKS